MNQIYKSTWRITQTRRTNVLHHVPSRHFTATSEAAAMKARMRRGVILASTGFACLVAAPAFYALGSVVNKAKPPQAETLPGDWRSIDGQSRLRFNKYNICEYTNLDDEDGRGPIQWPQSEDEETESDGTEIKVGFTFLGQPKSIRIDHWPSKDASNTLSMVVNGIKFVKK